MRNATICRIVASFALVAFALSCASGPAKIPDWILSRPAPDATFTYFVGEGSDEGGDPVKATQSATNSLIMNILSYIGVTVSTTSTAEEKSTLDSYAASVTSTITAKGENRLAGFAVREKVIVQSPNSKRVDVYILAAYETKELEKEKIRIQKVFEERDKAVAMPEAQGREYEASGRYFDAVRKYAEAAVAATGPEIVNAEIKLTRNINNARTVVGRIRIVKLNDNVEAAVGGAYSAPFRAKVVYGEGDSAPGIPGVNLVVTYSRKLPSGAIGSKSETAVTDPSGIVSFTPPAPDFVGKGKVTIKIDFQSTRELLDKIPSKYDALREALLEDMRSKQVEFSYTVVSNARNVSTGIAIVDIDEKGVAQKTGAAQGGLLQILTTNKFKVQTLAIDPAVLATMDDDAILRAAKAFLGKVERIIVGWAKIESVRLDSGMYFVTVRGYVKCFELSTGSLLYAVEKTAVGTASDEATARRTALQQLGMNTLGKDLMANLP